jgi:hypothetical protein
VLTRDLQALRAVLRDERLKMSPEIRQKLRYATEKFEAGSFLYIGVCYLGWLANRIRDIEDRDWDRDDTLEDVFARWKLSNKSTLELLSTFNKG